MKIKTSELTGAALDWAVAKCEGLDPLYLRGFDFEPTWRNGHRKRYSTDWSQGGPIIEREIHNLFKYNRHHTSQPPDTWCAVRYEPSRVFTRVLTHDGPTPLVAAMRCYVASKLGDEVEVPDELA